MAEVTVAIPTFRRPQGLERLLRALAALSTDARVHVLVGDNDSERHQGRDLCDRLRAEGYRWPIAAFIVPERGISQVRNELVERALAEPGTQFIAMVDDDEWPEPQWLDALLETQRNSGADVVRGSVLREFEAPPPVWAANWEGIAPIRYATGYTGMIEGIGNVLIARHVLEGLQKPCFDPAFGLSGGEDKDFFIRLRAQGGRFIRCDEAVVTEHVPASRTKLRWSLMRAYRTGNADMRIFLKYRQGMLSFAREVAKVIAVFALFPLLLLALSLLPARRLDAVRKLFRAAGKIGALFGQTYHEYATIHGK